MNEGVCVSCGFEISNQLFELCHCCEKVKVCKSCIDNDIFCPDCVDEFERDRDIN